MLIGYMRVSKADCSQSTNLQRDALVVAGVDPKHLYEDQASGKREDRPGLVACLKALREGDTLAVWKLDRLGRDLRHLINTVHDLTARGVGLKVLTGHGRQRIATAMAMRRQGMPNDFRWVLRQFKHRSFVADLATLFLVRLLAQRARFFFLARPSEDGGLLEFWLFLLTRAFNSATSANNAVTWADSRVTSAKRKRVSSSFCSTGIRERSGNSVMPRNITDYFLNGKSG